jgi:hypothetical protein
VLLNKLHQKVKIIFRQFIFWVFELYLAVVLDFWDEVEEQFQINLWLLLDAYIKTGSVLTDGMSAPREIPGTSSRRTWRMSRTYSEFISKKVDTSVLEFAKVVAYV